MTSHAEVLRSIAWARQCVASSLRLQADAPILQWQVISMEPYGTEDNTDTERVGARIKDARGPVSGAHVAFGRAPHLGCYATSDANGVAACTLQDPHGHGEH
jgi:hypothetical protein